jgi:beta-galactosidase/beta-glucuronidase
MSTEIPKLEDPNLTLNLDGDWRVARWPFAAGEAVLAGPDTDDATWETVAQPGKVFYADPEGEREEIPDWNRVTLTHIDPDDGAVLRRVVDVPSAWAGKRVVLRFDAVFPAGRFYINGTLLGEHMSGLTPVEFRGVNHLTFHPEHGMYTPEDWLRRNLSLMKKANVNAIRPHFMGPRCLANICDELGLYLLQELPVDWGTDYIHDPEWVPPALMRIEAGVRRDRHHPSVMVWSMGNENMPNTPENAEAGWSHLCRYDVLVKQLDPSRPTMLSPPGPANAIEGIIELRAGDIADTHYSFNHIKRFLEEGKVENPNSWKADMATHTREWPLRHHDAEVQGCAHGLRDRGTSRDRHSAGHRRPQDPGKRGPGTGALLMVSCCSIPGLAGIGRH